MRWLLVLLASCASTARTPPTYDCHRAPRLVIDGRLDDWSTIAFTERFRDIVGDRDVPLETRAALAWDDRYLYVAARLEQPHLLAELTKHDSVVYRDDDFEIFLDPSGIGRNYFELEINALETVFDLTLTKPYGLRGKANHKFDFRGLKKSVALDGTLNDPSDRDGGWTVELAIPWTDFAPFPRPRAGDSWRFNMSRVEWKKAVVDGQYEKRVDKKKPIWLQPMNWSWAPQYEIAMHKPQHWGFLAFR